MRANLPMRANLLKQSISVACTLLFAVHTSAASACTGVTLKAGDGSVVFGRTLEWGSFDLMSRLEIVPRGIAYKTHMPDGKAGLSWTGKYGVVGIDGVGKDLIIEGMNEKGLDVGLFYHPDFAEYQAYDPEKAAESLGPTDLGQYLLTNFATVDEVRATRGLSSKLWPLMPQHGSRQLPGRPGRIPPWRWNDAVRRGDFRDL